MSKVTFIKDYLNRNKPVSEQLQDMIIEVHKEIIEMHEKSILNYQQHKILLGRLNEIVNDKESKNED